MYIVRQHCTNYHARLRVCRWLPYNNASASCKAMRGAYLVSYNTAEEQLQVETYYKQTGAMNWYYWIGLEKSGSLYYWQDGTRINNGNMSNANPYTHFTYFYQDWLMYYPSYDRTIAHWSYQYDIYTGNDTYLQEQQPQYYKTTPGQDKMGWYPYPGVNHMHFMCEKPQALFACTENESPPMLDNEQCGWPCFVVNANVSLQRVAGCMDFEHAYCGICSSNHTGTCRIQLCMYHATVTIQQWCCSPVYVVLTV